MKPAISIYLDVVRLCAAFLVLFGHAFNFTGGYFHLLAGHTTAAVAIFFVLSGFVIAFVTDKKELTAKDYVVSRAARMYSVAIPAVVVTIVADQIGLHAGDRFYSHHAYFNPDSGWPEILRYLTFTNELWQDHIQLGTAEPYWSIGFEVWYYIIFGVFLFAPVKLTGRYILAGACMLVAGPKICIYFPLWLMGAWLYKFLKTPSGVAFDKVSVTPLLLTYVATPFLYLLTRHYLGKYTQPMFAPAKLDGTTLVTAVYFYAIGAIFCLNLFTFSKLANQTDVLDKIMNKIARPVRWIAGATFILYLTHQPLILATLSVNPLPEGSMIWAYSSLTFTVVMVFLIAEITERRKTMWKTLFSSLWRG